MSILNKSQLYEFRNSTRLFSKAINESLKEFSSENRIGKTTIFLSHKHKEKKELDSVISFLKKFNINVYVDWLDEGMPKSTSGMTAKRIKLKIKDNDKFIFLATEGAINSKWCNWELGFGDSHKYLENIAIFPIKDDNHTFSENEYLQIYPRIEFVSRFTVSRKIGGYFDEGYYVITPRDEAGISRYTKIEEWLKK